MLQVKSFASGSAGNAYFVSDGITNILIECGISVDKLQISLEYKLSEITACIISHQHKDHCKALKDVIKAGVDCYAPVEVFNSQAIVSHRAIPVKPLSKFVVGSFNVQCFTLQHDVINFGYLIQSTITGDKLLYFTDTYYLKYTFIGLNYIMGEANYSKEAMESSISDKRIDLDMKKRLVKSHMSIDNFVNMLKANDLSQVKQIYLLHLSNSNSNAEEFKIAVQKAAGCEVYVC